MLMRRTSWRGLGDANFVPIPLAGGGFDCGCGATVPAGGTCTPMPTTCQSLSAMSAPALACPAGYSVPTFMDGVNTMFSGLPNSLLGGITYLSAIGSANPGNVLGPYGKTPCYQATRETPAHVLGLASGSLALAGLLLFWLFGGRR
jgi:hypothetical protein